MQEYTIDIAVSFDVKEIMAKLHIPAEMEAELTKIANQAKQIAKPKGSIKVCPLKNEENSDGILIDEKIFPGKILKSNFKNINRVFLFLITEGTELEEWAKQFDFLEQFFVCEIRQSILNSGQEYIKNNIKEKFKIENVSSINPCALEIWDTAAQQRFYSLLQNCAKQIQIQIQPSLLLSPQYSMSGIMFQSSTEQHNCSFCPNIKCPNRKSPYINNNEN